MVFIKAQYYNNGVNCFLNIKVIQHYEKIHETSCYLVTARNGEQYIVERQELHQSLYS